VTVRLLDLGVRKGQNFAGSNKIITGLLGGMGGEEERVRIFQRRAQAKNRGCRDYRGWSRGAG